MPESLYFDKIEETAYLLKESKEIKMDEDFVIPSMPAHPAENQVITINFEEPKKSEKDLHLKNKASLKKHAIKAKKHNRK